ncbi:MAG TPA: DJ-1/PfpI family protein [Kofleriaceae bacterium]|nr:DJ-1/PfpI family protein [Kofleriaceae bacterium]
MARIACLVGPEFEDSELAIPVRRLKDADHEVELLGSEGGQKLAGKRGNEKVRTDAGVNERRPDQYDALSAGRRARARAGRPRPVACTAPHRGRTDRARWRRGDRTPPGDGDRWESAPPGAARRKTTSSLHRLTPSAIPGTAGQVTERGAQTSRAMRKRQDARITP